MYSIYEVFTQRYRPILKNKSPLALLTDELEAIRSLGFDAIRLLPITPVSQKDGWASVYKQSNMMALSQNAGNHTDLIKLVKKAHQLKMKVILEWIGHNMAMHSALVESSPKFFLNDKEGKPIPNVWGGAQFDFSNEKVHDYLLKTLKYWIETYDIDGYRCDVATLVPQRFWEKAISEVRRLKPETTFLAEIDNDPESSWSQVDPEYEKLPNKDPTERLLKAGFNWVYDRKLQKVFIALKEKKIKQGADAIWEELERQSKYSVPNAMMHFTSNHDYNPGQGPSTTFFGPANATLAALVHFLPGITLTYNGQEFGLNRIISHDEIGEKVLEQKKDESLLFLYKTLLKVKKLFPINKKSSLTSLKRHLDHPDVLVMTKTSEKNQTLLTFFNLSDKEQTIAINDPFLNGIYTSVLTKSKSIKIEGQKEFKLNPWEFGFLLKN